MLFYQNQIINSLKKINNYNVKYYNIDLIISGGGCSGFYYAGTFEIIKYLEKMNKIYINKIYATSAGVLAAIFYLCKIDIEEWIRAYNYAKNNKSNDFHNIIMKTLKHFIPNKAYQICNNILNIVLSKRTLFGFKKEIFNNFNSNDELLLYVSAAINVPFLISNNYMGIKINNNYYYDGVFVCNTPIQYNSQLPQLVFKTHKIEYPLKYAFSIKDKCIELLMIRGFIETDKFFRTEQSDTLFWIDKNLQKKTVVKRNKCFYIINLLSIGIYFIMNYNNKY